MKFTTIKISEQDKQLLSVFMGEEYPLEIDFNWLMPGWFKIQRYYVSEFGLLTSTFELSSIGIAISATHSSSFKYAYSFMPNGKYDEMKAVYEAVIEFIQWYNSQPQAGDKI